MLLIVFISSLFIPHVFDINHESEQMKNYSMEFLGHIDNSFSIISRRIFTSFYNEIFYLFFLRKGNSRWKMFNGKVRPGILQQ